MWPWFMQTVHIFAIMLSYSCWLLRSVLHCFIIHELIGDIYDVLTALCCILILWLCTVFRFAHPFHHHTSSWNIIFKSYNLLYHTPLSSPRYTLKTLKNYHIEFHFLWDLFILFSPVERCIVRSSHFHETSSWLQSLV